MATTYHCGALVVNQGPLKNSNFCSSSSSGKFDRNVVSLHVVQHLYPFEYFFLVDFFLIFWDFCFSFTLLQLDRNVCNVVCTAADREMFCPNRTNPIDRFQSGSNASSHMETYLEIVIAKLRISESIERLLMRQMYDFLQGSRHGTCLVV